MASQTIQPVTVNSTIDWIAVSKTLVLEGGFIGALITVLLGNHDPNVINLVWALGGSLFGLRLTDTLANVLNVRAFLAKPDTGLVPQTLGTTLIKTPTTAPNGGSNAGTSTP